MKTKKISRLSKLIALACLLSIISCSKEKNEDFLQIEEINYVESPDGQEPEGQVCTEIIPEEQLVQYSHELYEQKFGEGSKLKYNWSAHKGFTYICAKELGLSEERAIIMRDAAVMPDVYQVGIENGYNQQWSHAFILTKTIFGTTWLWGDADDDFHDNLDGDSGESESPEGYNGKWAGYYYAQDNKDLGDWYVGYACHFMEDIGFVLHTSFPNIPMATQHFAFEDWMDNNWEAGHRFIEDAKSVSANEYYSFTSPKRAINNAAKASNWYYSKFGKKAWEAYQASAYPTEAGTGSQELINYTRMMMVETTKWTGATIKYALDKYNKW